MAAAGPVAQAWLNPSAPDFYQQVYYDIAELIAYNNAAWEAHEPFRRRRALSTPAEDEWWWQRGGTGGAPPVGYAHDAFIASQNAGHNPGVAQVMAVADALALGSAMGRVADLGIEGMRAEAARSAAAERSVGAMARWTPEELIANMTEVAPGRLGKSGLRYAEGDFGSAEHMFDELRDPAEHITYPTKGVQVAPGRMGGNITLRPGGTAFGPGGSGLGDPRIDIHGATDGIFDSVRKIVFKETIK
jgi:hypothetical protein